MKNKSINKNRGFTLLEMIISLAIFTIVALIAVGALLKVMDANRKAIALKTAINNINFGLESMSREMRMGNTYHCDKNITDSGDFAASHGTRDCSTLINEWEVIFNTTSCPRGGTDSTYMKGYRFQSGKLMKAETINCGDSISKDDYVEMFSPDVNITRSQLGVSNSNSAPYARFYFSGEVGVKEKDKTTFEIQTSVSQRIR